MRREILALDDRVRLRAEDECPDCMLIEADQW